MAGCLYDDSNSIISVEICEGAITLLTDMICTKFLEQSSLSHGTHI